MGRTILVSGHNLLLRDVVEVARGGAKVRLDPSAVEFVRRGRALVDRWVEEGRVIYGITTGFGDLASVVIPSSDVFALQENLIRSHACGVGEELPVEVVRASMLLRVNTLVRGYSGIGLEALDLLVEMINRDVCPVIPSQGSVGASGDLAPLAHMALAMMGEGEVIYRGRRMPAKVAFEREGLSPVKLGPKEGLALINGTPVLTAMAALALSDALLLAKCADVALACSLEALRGVPYAFDPRIHELRPHPGQRASASNVRRMVEGSQILEASKGMRVQDAYSLRCAPQVHGACRDALDFVLQKVEVEINSVTDNPLIFPDEGDFRSGGNFHGEPIAIASDLLCIAASELASISERRVARLVDGKLSGLPPFLAKESGLNSGLMIPQYVCAALVSENKVLSHPASVDSIPTSANQEDHVSMGAWASRKAMRVVENSLRVVSIELLLAAQGLEFLKPLEPGRGVRAALSEVRKVVPFLERDCYLKPHLDSVFERVKGGEIVLAVEEAVGPLD